MTKRPRILEVEADTPSYEDEAPAVAPAGPPPVHEDGIYFGLDAEATYHRDLALGSGDIRRLLTNPPEYWWHSGYNALRPTDTDTTFKAFGRAVHVYVLEGEEEFYRLYERKNTDPDTLVTYGDVKRWLEDRGQKAPRKKDEAVALAVALDRNVKIADEIKRRAEAAGRTILRPDDYARICISSKTIAAHPELGDAFTGGMPEVAIFYTEIIDGEPVRCKALLDYMKIRGIGDLKSTSNPMQIGFPQLCANRFSDARMDLQIVHYLRAREFVARYVAEGRVFGDHDPAWLQKCAAAEAVGFVHVFFQAAGAPSVGARKTSPGNPILETAATERATSLQNFLDHRRQFGTDIWLPTEPMTEWDLNDLPYRYGRRQL